MIFYFSGTGNSQWVAQQIAMTLEDQMIPISKEFTKRPELSYNLKVNEPLIFIFPVYYWAPPKMVLEFVERMTLTGAKEEGQIIAVITCAKTAGNTLALLESALQKKGLKLTSRYTLVMPKNDNILGQVDSTSISQKKLSQNRKDLKDISHNIKKQQTGEVLLKKEWGKAFKTRVGKTILNHMECQITSFYATDDCISCKICEKICPTMCIKVEGKPSWRGDCVQCLACLQFCPKSAIQYGTRMHHKRRYTNPFISWYQLNQEEDFRRVEGKVILQDE